MSRKSSWWLRPQRKGASNRAALNEANYFMEHNKILQERINELAAENAKLRELLSESLMDYKLYARKYGLPPYFSDVNEHLDARMRELGVEVDG